MANIVSSEAAKGYTHLIKDIRRIVLGFLGFLILAFMAVMALMVLIYSLLAASQMPLEGAHSLMALISGILLVGSAGTLYLLLNEKMWVRLFKIDELVNKITGQKA